MNFLKICLFIAIFLFTFTKQFIYEENSARKVTKLNLRELSALNLSLPNKIKIRSVDTKISKYTHMNNLTDFSHTDLSFDYMGLARNGTVNDAHDNQHSNNYFALILLLFPVLAIFGNVLVVLSVIKQKNLHNVTNYLVVSLASSDLFVAAVVMPIAVYALVTISN